MIRTFQGRVTPGVVVVFILILSITFYFGWQKSMLALPLLLLVILQLERILHTCFIVSSQGILIISKGRFSKDKLILLQDIERIEKGSSFYTKIGVFSYLNIILKNGKELSVWPSDEKGFLEAVKKMHAATQNINTEK